MLDAVQNYVGKLEKRYVHLALMSLVLVSVTACGNLGLGTIKVEVISGICQDVAQIIPSDPIVYGDDNFNFLADQIFNAEDQEQVTEILVEFLNGGHDILTPATAGQIEVHNTFIDEECRENSNNR